jgi:arabinose-5-phosphate isomerase
LNKPLNEQEIITCGRQAVAVEAAALCELEKRLDSSFAEAVQHLSACRGKVILTGVGKSGIICRKIAATLASTGTPALFLHPTEGLHGDLGILGSQDLVLAISYSGATEELIKIIPSLKRQGLKLIAFTANPQSELARASDLVLDISTRREACPLGLAPTASTTVTLALGDALAVALLAARGFKPEDFALRHPGGTLGRRLLLKVEDIMHQRPETPLVNQHLPLKEALLEMTGKGFGVTGIIDSGHRLVGVITDGDLRRLLTRYDNPLELPVSQLMTRGPKTITPNELAATALKRMQDARITSLFILSPDNRTIGIIHLHDLLRAGVV